MLQPKHRRSSWRPQTIVLFSGLALITVLWFITVAQNLQPPPPSAALTFQAARLANLEHQASNSAWVSDELPPEHRILVCAKVGDEVPYLLEWLEFHRLQGVTKFVLYADDLPVSSENRVNTNALFGFKHLYDARLNLPDLIDVHSLTAVFTESLGDFLDHNRYKEETVQMHRLAQQSLLKHCYERYASKTEWIAHIDVDEFLYSPKFDSLTDFFVSLYDQRPDFLRPAESIAYAYQFGNMSGVYVWPVNYGMSSGRVLDYRVNLVADPIRGDYDVWFDPRYRRAVSDDDAEAQRIDLLQWINGTGHGLASDEKRRAWFADLLAKDTSHLATNRSDDISELLNSMPEIEKTLERYDRNSFDLYGAAALDRFVWSHTADRYPLLIEDQNRRMLSMDYGDTYEDVAAAVVSNYPHCEDYVRKLLLPINAKLRSKVATKDRLARLGAPNDEVCVPGSLPPQITNVGKTLTWTAKRFQPPSGWLQSNPQAYSSSKPWRRNPHMSGNSQRPVHDPRIDDPELKMQQCHLPWIHHCSHKTAAPVVSADIQLELRLDHHMFRSLERRTVADATWRNQSGLGRLGNGSDETNWNILQIASIKKDNSKLRFVAELRNSLQQFQVVPMPAEVRQRQNRFDYFTVWDVPRCSAAKMFTSKQMSCPAQAQNTGFLGSRIYPPHGLVPRNWCSYKNVSVEPILEERYYDVDMAFDDCQKGHNMDKPYCQILQRMVDFDYDFNDTSVCPGYPHMGCCDHDPQLIDKTRHILSLIGADKRFSHAYERNLTARFWITNSSINYSGLW